MKAYKRNWSGPFRRRGSVRAVAHCHAAHPGAGVLQEAVLPPAPGSTRIAPPDVSSLIVR